MARVREMTEEEALRWRSEAERNFLGALADFQRASLPSLWLENVRDRLRPIAPLAAPALVPNLVCK